MKKQLMLTMFALSAVGSVQACLNTIKNDTQTIYKLVEIKEGNKDLKKEHQLPKELEKNEEIAKTLKPGEEVACGGHYVPTFMIYKKYPDGNWHAILLVKQTRCGPRGYEDKYLLMSDLLKRDLPGDYGDVYKFTLKKEASEIEPASAAPANPEGKKNAYQDTLIVLQEQQKKVLEIVSELVNEIDKLTGRVDEAGESVFANPSSSELRRAGATSDRPAEGPEDETSESEESDKKQGCTLCKG